MQTLEGRIVCNSTKRLVGRYRSGELTDLTEEDYSRIVFGYGVLCTELKRETFFDSYLLGGLTEFVGLGKKKGQFIKTISLGERTFEPGEPTLKFVDGYRYEIRMENDKFSLYNNKYIYIKSKNFMEGKFHDKISQLKGDKISILIEIAGPGFGENPCRYEEATLLVANIYDRKERVQFKWTEVENYCMEMGLDPIPRLRYPKRPLY